MNWKERTWDFSYAFIKPVGQFTQLYYNGEVSIGKSAFESHPGNCFGSRLSPSPCMEELKNTEGPTAVQMQSRPCGRNRAIACYWIPLVEWHPTWLQECWKPLFYDLDSIKHQEVSYPILIRTSRKKKRPGIRNKNVNTDVLFLDYLKWGSLFSENQMRLNLFVGGNWGQGLTTCWLGQQYYPKKLLFPLLFLYQCYCLSARVNHIGDVFPELNWQNPPSLKHYLGKKSLRRILELIYSSALKSISFHTVFCPELGTP